MKLTFTVTGMTCAACSSRVEKVTRAVPGVTQADVNLLAGSMQAEVTDASVTAAIEAAVEKAGYHAFLPEEKKDAPKTQEDPMKEMKTRIIGSAACLVVLMYFTMGHMAGLPVPGWYHGAENGVVAGLLQLFLTLPVVYLNRVYYFRGLKALYHRSPNMDSLIAVGSLAALIYGIAALFRMAYGLGHGDMELVKHYLHNLYFESAAMILTLITLGKFLEARAKGKTGDAIRSLMDLSPKTATVRRDGAELTVPVEQVQVGDTVIVPLRRCHRRRRHGAPPAGQALTRVPLPARVFPWRRSLGTGSAPPPSIPRAIWNSGRTRWERIPPWRRSSTWWSRPAAPRLPLPGWRIKSPVCSCPWSWPSRR